jgi:hypothetical protein
MKKYREDGTFYYTYYKKKRGRKKKRGPKKVRYKKKEVKNYQRWDFKILRFDFKKQVQYIGLYHDYPEVCEKRRELEAENAKIELPIKYVNNKRVSKRQYHYESEYVVLKRIRDRENESNESMLPNEYGKIVKHVTTSENWYVYEKFPCLVEETFWAYGYNPRSDRKTIGWIYTNFIDAYIDDTYELVQVYAYNNKLVIRYSGDEINFVIAKNVSDCIRMYNFLEDKYKNSKQVYFTGFATSKTQRVLEVVQLIKDKTGWYDTKIYRKHT